MRRRRAASTNILPDRRARPTRQGLQLALAGAYGRSRRVPRRSRTRSSARPRSRNAAAGDRTAVRCRRAFRTRVGRPVRARLWLAAAGLRSGFPCNSTPRLAACREAADTGCRTAWCDGERRRKERSADETTRRSFACDPAFVRTLSSELSQSLRPEKIQILFKLYSRSVFRCSCGSADGSMWQPGCTRLDLATGGRHLSAQVLQRAQAAR